MGKAPSRNAPAAPGGAGSHLRLGLAEPVEDRVGMREANALAVGDLLRRLARESGTAVVCATHDPLLVHQADGLALSHR